MGSVYTPKGSKISASGRVATGTFCGIFLESTLSYRTEPIHFPLPPTLMAMPASPWPQRAAHAFDQQDFLLACETYDLLAAEGTLGQDWQPLQAEAYRALIQQATQAYQAEDYHAALPALLQALGYLEATLGTEHELSRSGLMLLSSCLLETGLMAEDSPAGDVSRLVDRLRQAIQANAWSQALPLARSLRSLIARIHGQQHRDYAGARCNLGVVWGGLGQRELAEEEWVAAAHLYHQLAGPTAYGLGLCLHELGKLYLTQPEQLAQAEQYLLGSLGVVSQHDSDPQEVYLANLQLLAGLYVQTGRDEEAVQALSQLLPMLAEREHPYHALMTEALAEARARLAGDPPEARGDSAYQTYQALLKQLQAAVPRHAWAEAHEAAEAALDLAQATWGEASAEYAQSLYLMGGIYHHQQAFRVAQGYMAQALATYEALGLIASQEYALTLASQANLFQELANYEAAASAFARADELFGPWESLRQHAAYFFLVHNRGTLAYKRGDYPAAGRYFAHATALAEALPNEPLLPQVLASQTSLHLALGQWEAAETCGQAHLAALVPWGRSESMDAALGHANLGYTYRHTGRYQAATAQFEQAISVAIAQGEGPHPVLMLARNGLATLWIIMGNYVAAEQLLAEVLAESAEQYGPDHPYTAQIWQNMGMLYVNLRQWERGEEMLQHAAKVQAAATGEQHPEYGLIQLNLLLLFLQTGRFEAVRQAGETLLPQLVASLGPSHSLSLMLLGHLATAYSRLGAYEQAERACTQAIAQRDAQFGPHHPETLLLRGNLGVLYQRQGQYPAALAVMEALLPEADRHAPPGHPLHASLCLNLAHTYALNGQPALAAPQFEQGFAHLQQQAERQFAGLTEEEKGQYLTQVTGFMHLFFSFCWHYPAQQTAMAGLMMDLQLLYKGLLLDRTRHWRREVLQQQDPVLREVFAAWSALRERLAWAYRQPLASLAAQGLDLSLMENELRGLEKQLLQRFPFSTGKDLHWPALQARLQPGEAAMEIVRFEEHGDQDWTGRIGYAVLVLRWDAAAPACYLLPEGKALETSGLADFRRWIEGHPRQRRGLTWATLPASPAVDPTRLYDQFLAPFAAALVGLKRVYGSADGVYQQVPLGLMPHPEGGYWQDRLELRWLAATRDLLDVSLPLPAVAVPKAILFGDPDFQLAPAAKTAQLEAMSIAPQPRLRAEGPTRGAFGALPGTAQEVEGIAALLQRQGWTHEVYCGAQALEDVLKEHHQAQVLHLATHGFYLDQTVETQVDPLLSLNVLGADNPLLRSGLVFAGANHPDPTTEDGLLFAYEMAQFDLSQAQLVVLSACDTGLGELRAGEGVYGLVRACQLAGARCVLVSGWKVDDQATAELMLAFYGHWLQHGDPHLALRAAQADLRARDPHPFFWGAFQVVGAP
jgi:tetratricopeptide (TPR) repeat protein